MATAHKQAAGSLVHIFLITGTLYITQGSADENMLKTEGVSISCSHRVWKGLYYTQEKTAKRSV
jgi:hypothetical protein